MDQQRQGTWSTKPVPIDPDTMEEVPQLPNNNFSHHVYMTISDLDGKLYSDQTGRFTITSNHGNFCVITFYAVGGTYIKVYTIKSRHRSRILKAYDYVHAFLRVWRYRPQMHNMDNETSKDVENFIADQKSKVQYTPVDIHRTNISEAMLSHVEEPFHGCEGRCTPFFSYGTLV